VLETVWTGEPIEILFLDMAKTWQVNDFVIGEFLPSLIPGHSIIIQQDYLWGSSPWLHITMELLAPCVTVLDSMSHGSVAYLLTKPIPEEIVGINLREALSAANKRTLMDRAVERWQGDERGMVEIARVKLLEELDGPARVPAAIRSILARYSEHPRVTSCVAFEYPAA